MGGRRNDALFIAPFIRSRCRCCSAIFALPPEPTLPRVAGRMGLGYDVHCPTHHFNASAADMGREKKVDGPAITEELLVDARFKSFVRNKKKFDNTVSQFCVNILQLEEYGATPQGSFVRAKLLPKYGPTSDRLGRGLVEKGGRKKDRLFSSQETLFCNSPLTEAAPTYRRTARRKAPKLLPFLCLLSVHSSPAEESQLLFTADATAPLLKLW